jgi:predicted PurR-regulated permease PerM
MPDRLATPKRYGEGGRTIDIAPAAIAKILATIVLVWLWLQLWRFLVLFVVAIVLAIALDPLVAWLERRRLSRGVAATGAVFVIAVLIVGFFWIAGSSLSDQANMLGDRITHFKHDVVQHVPDWVANAVQTVNSGSSNNSGSSVADAAVAAGRAVLGSLVVGALALILTVYLLIDGRRTYQWLLAYAPPSRRPRVHRTAVEAHKAIFAYVRGNVITSLLATAVTFVALTLLSVPAALLLAVLAGIFDFVPVLGFICSSVPAIILALAVSPTAAVIVAIVYVTYHALENYYIGPRVYGGRLRLSDLAVIVAFAVGAEVGGVVGALLALPFAALYPVIENVWLQEYLGRDTTEAHRRIERTKTG